MARPTTLALAAAALVYAASSAAMAQSAPPSYQGDPDVYKVIFEDQNFRVIAVDRKKGVHDKVHGHPILSVIYNITDCDTKIYAVDGKTVVRNAKAGTASAVDIVASHSAENVGPNDCKQLLVERK